MNKREVIKAGFKAIKSVDNSSQRTVLNAVLKALAKFDDINTVKIEDVTSYREWRLYINGEWMTTYPKVDPVDEYDTFENYDYIDVFGDSGVVFG